jgi:hypothetical protein
VIPPGPSQDRAAVAVAQRWGQQEPVQAGAWVAQFADPRLQADAASALVDVWAQADLAGCRQWVESLPDGAAREAGRMALRKQAGAESADPSSSHTNLSSGTSAPMP